MALTNYFTQLKESLPGQRTVSPSSAGACSSCSSLPISHSSCKIIYFSLYLRKVVPKIRYKTKCSTGRAIHIVVPLDGV